MSSLASSPVVSDVESEFDATFSAKAPMDKLKTIQTRCETIASEAAQKAKQAYKDARKAADSMNDENNKSSHTQRAGQIARATVLAKGYLRIRNLSQAALNIAKHISREEALEATTIAAGLVEMATKAAINASVAIDKTASQKAKRALRSVRTCIEELNFVPLPQPIQHEEEIDFENFDDFNLLDHMDDHQMEDHLINSREQNIATTLEIAQEALTVADSAMEFAQLDAVAQVAGRENMHLTSDALSIVAKWNIRESNSPTSSDSDEGI